MTTQREGNAVEWSAPMKVDTFSAILSNTARSTWASCQAASNSTGVM